MDKKKHDTARLNALDILSVADQLGIHVGRNKMTLCFLHAEKTPSLSFKAATNRWHCFGCGAGGGVIDLVAKHEGISFVDACNWLEKAFGVNSNISRPVKLRPKAYVKAETPEKPPIDSALYAAIINGLELSSKAAEYLCVTRALPATVVEQSKIRSVEHVASFYEKITAAYGEKRLLSGGFFKVEKSGEVKRSWQRPGIVFPYYAYNGELVNLQLRPYSSSGPKYIFLSGTHTAMYNEHALKGYNTGDTIYLCEGAVDALTLSAKGYKAVGIPGVNSFREAWLNYIGQFNVIILFDNDASGIKRAEVLRKRLLEKNINAQVQHVPSCYKDVNEMLVAEKKLEQCK